MTALLVYTVVGVEIVDDEYYVSVKVSVPDDTNRALTKIRFPICSNSAFWYANKIGASFVLHAQDERP